eukprot:jgi/Botrbrau1/23240/Bobra.0041s0076.1
MKARLHSREALSGPITGCSCWHSGHARAPLLLQRSNIRLGHCRGTQAPSRCRRAVTHGLKVWSLDAAMPFDFEHRAQEHLAKKRQLKIGIVGFGTFGQFLGKRLVEAGHKVLATSRTPYYSKAAEMGVTFYEDPNDFCEEHPEVVVLASSILSLDSVLSALPVQRLRRNTLFVDVLSVKQFPKSLLLSRLPPEVDILCTHPMFGPDSGKGSWEGLNLMFEKVRIRNEKNRESRCDAFLQFFETQGCRMVEMTCEEHDRKAAGTQFVTHTVGRVLGHMGLQPTEIDTKGFESLLNLVNNTNNDSFELYYGLFMYNQNATEMLESLERAFDSVKSQLFQRLHDKLREELFPVMPASQQQNGNSEPYALLPQPQPEASPSGDGSPPDVQRTFASMDQANS